MIVWGINVASSSSLQNQTVYPDIVNTEPLQLSEKQIEINKLPNSETVIDNISSLQVTDISKESDIAEELTEGIRNLSTSQYSNIDDSQLKPSTSESPKIIHKWYGLDIYSAAEIKQTKTTPSFRPINPPDVTLAVGKNHVAQIVHSNIGFWDKSGVPIKKMSLHDFFNISKENYITDPKILFDNSSDHWYATLVDGGKEKFENGSAFPTCLPVGCKVIIAMSSNGDPMRQWFLFSINATKFGNFPDMPKISVSNYNLTMSTLEFQVYPTINESDNLPKTIMMDKNLIGRKNPTINVSFMEPDYLEYPIPSHHTSNCSSTASLYKDDPLNTYSSVSKIRITDYCNPHDMGNYVSKYVTMPRLFPAPILKQPLLRDVKNFNEMKYELTILSAIRNETSVWLGLQSNCEPVFSSNYSCINILRFDKFPERFTYSYRLTGNSQIRINNTDIYYPAMGITKDEKLLFISGFSNATIFPSLMVSHLVSENQTKNKILIFGSNVNNSTVYGDYFGSAIDPCDGSIWVSGQFSDDSIPVPSNIPIGELSKTSDKTWSTIIANIS